MNQKHFENKKAVTIKYKTQISVIGLRGYVWPSAPHTALNVYGPNIVLLPDCVQIAALRPLESSLVHVLPK